jgi:hypothetical protein
MNEVMTIRTVCRSRYAGCRVIAQVKDRKGVKVQRDDLPQKENGVWA